MTDLDEAKVEEFSGQMVAILNSGMAANMMSIGHQVGLFDAMAGLGVHATSPEIAKEAELDERYVREWLGAMATARIVDYDGTRDTYLLPAEHAALTTRAAGPKNLAAYTQFVPMCAGVEAELVEKFRTGGGVPYSSYPRFHEAMREMSGATFDAMLVDVTLPLVPGAVGRLEDGIRVADVGTGSGHAINVMAQAFPNSQFEGIDFSDEALAVGRAEAEEWGLTNATFVQADAAEFSTDSKYDLITTFDAVHDQADPQSMVNGIYAALADDGYWLCIDVRASSNVGENLDHPMGTFLYGVSCQHCMTVSLADDGDGLGAVWGVQKAREIFANAGFGDVTVNTIEGDPTNNYYVCSKA